MSDKKYFVLMENGKDTSQVFVSKQPRGAALKAATREVPNPIQLRERGTNRVHNFEGWTEIVIGQWSASFTQISSQCKENWNYSIMSIPFFRNYITPFRVYSKRVKIISILTFDQ